LSTLIIIYTIDSVFPVYADFADGLYLACFFFFYSTHMRYLQNATKIEHSNIFTEQVINETWYRMMKYYVSHCASHHAIKGRLNIAVRGFIRSKFNLHSAFKQERAQPCVGKLSGMLRNLIYGSLSTRSDPVFTQSLTKLSTCDTSFPALQRPFASKLSNFFSFSVLLRRIVPGLD